MRRLFKYTFILCLAILLNSCGEKEPQQTEWAATPYELPIPKYFPTMLNIPDDNPLTVEGITLGRYLFYDGRLSGRTEHDSLMSCGSCHVQANSFKPGISNPAFTDGRPAGLTGKLTRHAALPLINLVWNSNGYTWNGAVYLTNPNEAKRNIEDLILMSINNPAELAGDTTKVVNLIQNTPGYPDLFYKAFGSSKVTIRNISKAIAQFVRTLVSSDSRFDQYMRGDLQLTTEELEGFVLFTTEEGGDCFHCHGSSGNPLFTTNLFYNNGKDTVFNTGDDRFSITGNPSDIGAYKATTMRNVAVTGPYMHDGRFKTLDEVIEQYSHHVKRSDNISPLMHHVNEGGVQLTPLEKVYLKAFLQSLTDETFLNNTEYSAPATFPDGKEYKDVRGKY